MSFKSKNFICLFFSFFFAFYCVTNFRYLYDNPNFIFETIKTFNFLKEFLLYWVVFYIITMFIIINSKEYQLPQLHIYILISVIFVNLISFLSIFIKNFSIPAKYSIRTLALSLTIILFFYFFNFFNLYKQIQINKRSIKIFLFSFFLINFIIFLIKNIFLFNSFHLGRHDLGIFINQLWLLANGYEPITWLEANGTELYRVIHFAPFMYLLSILYKLFNYSEVLLFFLGALALYLSLVIFYFLSLKIIKNHKFAFITTLLYLFSPYFMKTYQSVFGPDMFLPLFYFCFILFALKRNFLLSSIFGLLSISLKEVFPIYIGFTAIFIYLMTKEKKYLLFSLFSFFYFVFVTQIFLPARNPLKNPAAETIIENIKNYEFLRRINIMQFIFTYLGSVAFLPLLNIWGFFLLLIPPSVIHMIYFRPILFEWQYTYSGIIGIFPLVAFVIKENIEKVKHFTFLVVFALINSFLLSIYFTRNFFIPKNIYIFVSILLFFVVVFLFLKLKNEIKKIILLLFFLIIISYINYYKYVLKEIKTDKERKIILEKVIKLLPEDKLLPIIASDSLIVKIANRKYIGGFYDYKETLLLLNSKKFKEIYFLVDLKGDNFLDKNYILKEYEIFKKIDEFLNKNKYKKYIIFNEKNIILIKYNKV